ncbi:ribonuclease P protein subunit p25-like protein [Aedes aegypti]|uniref:DNA/RNA-binding protein Alba-like domain-containing protein n=1 Tax=Aedes aegypti TaxID=7159 RepID=A0A6I8TL07_AEDAE|nr:ribonuclease P protein subunit p25-like protein [Aedes aegypti]XP_021695646.1 ribonuclease P protein subunit p25-like protein [Aedes aegypti]XP_021695647.1 ribonuclease P protein subunit p25-like protein [Aedes aegypti]
MMHYKKGKNVEEELTKEQIPIECLPGQFLWMHVKGGSAIFNLVNYAKKALEAGEHRAVVWSGTGGGITKTISCAEIMKKDFELHQVTRVCYRKVEEYWDPQQEGLEQIVATRNIPSIHILMSLDELDPKTPGYQHSKTRTTFWLESDPTGAAKGGPRKGGNYFTGPQLKKKPNRNYEDDKSGPNANGGGRGDGGGKKGKNKNKGGKAPDEKGDKEPKRSEASGSGENKSKKTKNNENRQKAKEGGAGSKSEKASLESQPMELGE